MLQWVRNTFAGALRNRDSERVRGAFVSGSLPAHKDDPQQALGNPLRGLTPLQAVTILEASMRGEWTRAQWLMYYVENLDADMLVLVDRRCGGVRQLGWTIRVDEKADERGLGKLAEEQEEALREAYLAVDNLSEAVEHLALAKFRSYSHLHKQRGEDGRCTHLEVLDQWWWVRNGMYGDWYYNPDAKITTYKALGEPIDQSEYIIRVEPRALIWIGLTKFLRANYNQKWWDQFCEIASKHGTVIIGPDGMTPEQAEVFKSDALNIAIGNSGVLPFGSEVHHVGIEKMGDATPYEKALQFLSSRLVMAGTGGQLTMLAQATGIGGQQGEEHGKVWRSLLRGDSKDISEVLKQQFGNPELERTHPGKPKLAWFELDITDDVTPSTVFQDAKTAKEAGYLIDPDQLREKTGYTITAAPEPSTPPPPPEQLPNRGVLRNRAFRSADLVADMAEQLGVPESWFSPVAGMLEEIEAKAADESVSDADLVAFLEEAVKRAPELFEDMAVEDLAAVFDGALGAAAMEGARQGLRDRAKAGEKTA